MFKAKTDRKKRISMIVSQYSETLYWKNTSYGARS